MGRSLSLHHGDYPSSLVYLLPMSIVILTGNAISSDSDYLSWYRISERVWIPDPKHIAGAAWLSDAVASKQHYKWGAIAEGLKKTATTTTPPPEFTDTIANARVHLEDLLRSSTEATSIRGNRDRGRTSESAEARRSV